VASITVDQKNNFLFAGDLNGTLHSFAGPEFLYGEKNRAHEGAITSIALAKDRLFTFGWDRQLKTSSLADGSPREAGTLLKAPGFGHDLAISPDGQTMLASDWRGTLYQMDLKTMNLPKSWRAHLDQKNPPSNWLGTNASPRIKIAYSPSGEKFASVGI